MAGGRPLLCSTKLRLYFALILIILIILGPSGLLSVLNRLGQATWNSTILRGLGLKARLLSHASRSSIRVSYYCNSVATFRLIINLIHDIELNPGPFQANSTTKKTSSSSRSRRRLQRICIINKVYLGKILNRNLG